ncbi:MAG: hypothetical protein WC805_02590 [Patescibacteria group bacterium]|jgi:hypothetical protein
MKFDELKSKISDLTQQVLDNSNKAQTLANQADNLMQSKTAVQQALADLAADQPIAEVVDKIRQADEAMQESAIRKLEQDSQTIQAAVRKDLEDTAKSE